MIANPADSGTYRYSLFEETRTLNPTSYDVFIDELLFTADFENGLPFTLTKSEVDYEPELGLQRFGLFGSSNANVDPDYLFDNIILSTGADITGDLPDSVLQAGDADMDLDFDQLDLVKVQIAAKYLTGQAATWGEGDWNGAPGGEPGNPPVGNGLFDQLDIVFALAAGKYLAGSYAALALNGRLPDERTTWVDDAGTGELSVDVPAVGSLAGGGDLGDVDLVHVPEPASALLLALGFVIGLFQIRQFKR